MRKIYIENGRTMRDALVVVAECRKGVCHETRRTYTKSMTAALKLAERIYKSTKGGATIVQQGSTLRRRSR